jgi:hypothetical protein
MAENEQLADAEEGALEEAFFLYRDAGLRLPPIPAELAPKLEEVAEWLFASSDVDLMDLAGFVEAANKPEAEPEVAFGHVGHGVASWFLCYRLIIDPLAVFLRQRFGAAVDGADEGGVELFNSTAAELEELVIFAEVARRRGTLAPGTRLVLVLDDRAGDFWQIGPGPQQASEQVLADATRFLKGAS